MKRCSNCGEEKYESDFHKNRCGKDGLRSYCKLCSKLKRREWDLLNNLRKRDREKKYRSENRQLINIIKKKEYQKNNEKYLTRAKQYVINHPEIRKKIIETHKPKAKLRNKRSIDSLDDRYIINKLKELYLIVSPSPELIETYRQQIKIKRLLKQKKNGNAEKNTEASQPEIDLSLLR